MDLDQRMAVYQAFLEQVGQLQTQYARSRDPEELAEGIRSLSKNKAHHP